MNRNIRNNSRSFRRRVRGRPGAFRNVPGRNLRFMLNGAKHRPRHDPPSIVENPWNSLTIAYESNGPSTLTTKNIEADVLGTLGLSLEGYANFNLRIQRAHLWEMTGNFGLVAEFNDIIHGTSEAPYAALATIDDNPGKNHWANVGFSWPNAHSTYTLLPDRSDLEVLSVFTEDAANILMHIRVLWKTNTEAETLKSTFRRRQRRPISRPLRPVLESSVNSDSEESICESINQLQLSN